MHAKIQASTQARARPTPHQHKESDEGATKGSSPTTYTCTLTFHQLQLFHSQCGDDDIRCEICKRSLQSCGIRRRQAQQVLIVPYPQRQSILHRQSEQQVTNSCGRGHREHTRTGPMGVRPAVSAHAHACARVHRHHHPQQMHAYMRMRMADSDCGSDTSSGVTTHAHTCTQRVAHSTTYSMAHGWGGAHTVTLKGMHAMGGTQHHILCSAPGI